MLGPKELWVKSETIVFLFFGQQNKFRENRLDFILLHITHSNILRWGNVECLYVVVVIHQLILFLPQFNQLKDFRAPLDERLKGLLKTT